MANQRVTSAPTSVTIVALSGPTALKTAIANTSQPNGFSEFMQPSFFTRTKDPREPNATSTETDPCQDFRWTSPTEQGDAGPSLGYTLLDWGGKICYDPIARKVMFAANGANPGGTNVRAYSWQFNKYSTYDEATDTWSQERGVKGDNEGADPDCIVHMLGNNCIDVVGRRFFKKKFREERILVRDLTTGTWTTIPSPPGTGNGESSSNRSGGLDFVPNRGTGGKLWGFLSHRQSDNFQLYEIDPANGDWSVLLAESAFGSAGGSLYGVPTVYNPRAFGGQGGVLVGGQEGLSWKITCPDTGAPTVYSAGAPAVKMTAATGNRVCRDPVGDGWYHFVSATGKVYRTSGNAADSTWVEVATMPARMADAPNMVLCPLDEEGAEYGAIWVLCSYLGGPDNGHAAWIFRP